MLLYQSLVSDDSAQKTTLETASLDIRCNFSFIKSKFYSALQAGVHSVLL